MALGNSWSVDSNLKDSGTLSGCLFTEKDSQMALCKGLLCISNPISATRPSGRVASSVGNSLAAAMFPLGQVTRPSFLPNSVGDRGRRWDGIKRYQLYRDGRWVGFEDEDEYEI